MRAGTAVRPVTAGTITTVGQAVRVQTVQAALTVPAAALVLKDVLRTAPVVTATAAARPGPSGPSAPHHREVLAPAATSGVVAAREPAALAAALAGPMAIAAHAIADQPRATTPPARTTAVAAPAVPAARGVPAAATSRTPPPAVTVALAPTGHARPAPAAAKDRAAETTPAAVAPTATATTAVAPVTAALTTTAAVPVTAARTATAAVPATAVPTPTAVTAAVPVTAVSPPSAAPTATAATAPVPVSAALMATATTVTGPAPAALTPTAATAVVPVTAVSPPSAAPTATGARPVAGRRTGAVVRPGTVTPGQAPGEPPHGAPGRTRVMGAGIRARDRTVAPADRVVRRVTVTVRVPRLAAAPGATETIRSPGRHASPARGFLSRSVPISSTPTPRPS